MYKKFIILKSSSNVRRISFINLIGELLVYDYVDLFSIGRGIVLTPS